MPKDKINIKETKKIVKNYVKEYGLSKAHRIIKQQYNFFPQLRKTMLFILYEEYHFYKFRNKEKIK